MTDYVVPQSGLYQFTLGRLPGPADAVTDDQPDPLEAVKSAMDTIRAARRVVYCDPALVEKLQAAIDRERMGGLIKVEASSFVPAGQIIVVPYPPSMFDRSEW